MKHIPAMLLLGASLFSFSLAQQRSYPSYFSLTESADIQPHVGLYLSVGTEFFAGRSDVFRGQARLALANAAEISFIRQEGAVNFFGNAWQVPQWELKLRILEGSNNNPTVSVAFRSFFNWQLENLFAQDIASLKPALTKQGLNGSRYENRLSSGALIVSQKLFPRVEFTGAVGVQEIQSRFLWIFIDPAPYQSNGFYAPQIERTLMLNGFLNARFDLRSDLTLFAEAQSVPVISPNINRMALDYDRGYLTLVGLRYVAFYPVAVDGMIAHQLGFDNSSSTQFRIGLSFLAGF